jgi:hypothetical protein
VREHPMERLNLQATVVPSSRSYWSSEIERKAGTPAVEPGGKKLTWRQQRLTPAVEPESKKLTWRQQVLLLSANVMVRWVLPAPNTKRRRKCCMQVG